MVNFGLFSGEQNFSTKDTSYTFCRSATKFGRIRGLVNRNLLLEFRELSIRVTRDTMWRHPSILHWCTYKVVFWQIPVFADSFRLISIHCCPKIRCRLSVYKCLASVVPCDSMPSLFVVTRYSEKIPQVKVTKLSPHIPIVWKNGKSHNNRLFSKPSTSWWKRYKFDQVNECCISQGSAVDFSGVVERQMHTRVSNFFRILCTKNTKIGSFLTELFKR